MITNLLQYHLIHRIQHQITHRADRTAFRQWSPNGELQLTWGEAATRIDRIAAGLLGLGVEVQERIGIFANNTMARALTDLAILHLRGISVPLYSTNTPAQAAFVTNDADIRILFVGEQAQLTPPSRCAASARSCAILSSSTRGRSARLRDRTASERLRARCRSGGFCRSTSAAY